MSRYVLGFKLVHCSILRFLPDVNIFRNAAQIAMSKNPQFQRHDRPKGKSDIGDKINTQIIQPLIDANPRLARSDFPDNSQAEDAGFSCPYFLITYQLF